MTQPPNLFIHFVEAQKFLELIDRINDLKQLPRTGWLLAGISSPESIADHSLATALVALLLADAINTDWPSQGLTQPLADDRVLRIALVHDLAESLLTDLPKRSTDLLSRSVKHAAEAQAMTQLFQAMPTGDSYRQLWHEYAEAATPEAKVVRDADKLEMVHQAWRYEQRGHRNLQEFWQGHTWQYPLSRALFEHLYQQRGG
jgi:putative hydrolases of HD superfamily